MDPREINMPDLEKLPRVSVICLNKNDAPTLPEAVSSVLNQTINDLEFIVADGGSTDSSLDILRNHSSVVVLDGADGSRTEGIMRAVEASRGKFIAFTTSTDGYLLPEWLEIAVEHLEKNPDLALVWGASIVKDGKRLINSFHPRQFVTGGAIPQRKKWFFAWATKGLQGSYLPELNYCIHASLYKKLISEDPNEPELASIDPILRVLFEFARQGYLPEYLPVLANFGRTHPNQGQSMPIVREWEQVFEAQRNAYVKKVLRGDLTHVWRRPDGSVICKLERSEIASHMRRNSILNLRKKISNSFKLFKLKKYFRRRTSRKPPLG